MTPTTGAASAAVLIAAAMWGLYWIPVRHLEAAGVDGALTVALLNGPAAVLSGIWAIATWRAQKAYWRIALLIGVFAGAALALYGISLVHTSVIRATMLFYLMPVWATLIGIYWLGERAGTLRWIAIALGLAGMSLLLGGGSEGLNIGDFFALLSGIIWAVATAVIKRAGTIPIAGMLSLQFLFVAIFALLFGVMVNPDMFQVPAEFSQAVSLSVMISVFGVLPAIVMIFWASQFLFPGRVGLLLMSEVVVAIISASLLLPEEALSIVQWGAVALIICASSLELVPLERAKQNEA